MFCMECGAENAAEAKFCAKCGTKVESPPVGSPRSVQQDIAAQPQINEVSPALEKSLKYLCPNCNAEVAVDAINCQNCKASFGMESSWKPTLAPQVLPPLTGDKISNGIVWMLALAPVIGTFLQFFFAGRAGGTSVEIAKKAHDLWFITGVLNIALCIADFSYLKSVGHDASKFGGWVFLVPVYLYKRAIALKQPLSYFIVWIICFVLTLFV